MYLIIEENGRYYTQEAIDISEWEFVKKALLHFCLQTFDSTPYANWELYSLDGIQIDSCFVSDKEENVNADVMVYKKGGASFSALELREYEGEQFQLTQVCFEEPLGEMFAGETLYQLPPMWAQSMSYVMTTKNGKVIVVDGGCEKDTSQLETFIKDKGGIIHHLFITHYHNDHIGAILGLLKNGEVKIEKMYYNFPEPDLLTDRGDADNYLVTEFPKYIPDEVKVITPRKGDCYSIDGINVRVLNDASFSYSLNFCNDSSVVYKFETAKSNLLFTGDLGMRGDDFLQDEWFCKQISDCTIVQMAHHGQNGVSKDFYDKTAVNICLYPTPRWLWNNDGGKGKNSCSWQTLITREWMRERNVKRFYTSITPEIVEIK